ncbi:MAG: methyltransferase domain-containing protein [Lachnospiraceae bacterium]|nr:methyltransferase domain-containing protein [Lachnospiraceae bacterium]
MSEWNSEQYLKFQNQRTQPAIDLAKRIEINNPKNILDVGCGPGNSTKVLKNVFPNAHILGIDSSENMIKKAREVYSDIAFKVMDITSENQDLENFDIIFSNACLQWIPNHRDFIPRLFSMLSKGGVLAVQIPMNFQEKLFTIMNETVKDDKWDFSSMSIEPNEMLKQEEYFDILSSLTDHFDIWETVYYHNMPSIDAMVEWIKGTRLRPYLDALNGNDAEKFINEITEKASRAYNRQENGEFIFKFRRFFFLAVR